MHAMTCARLLAFVALSTFGLGCRRSHPDTTTMDGASADAGPPRPLRVAAASDLATVFPEIGKAFEAHTGRPVEFQFGSSGLLAKQIEQGAPFDVFAAANEAFVDEVTRDGTCLGDTKRTYARGRLAFASKDASMLPSSAAELKDPKFKKIAIANPEHAPYGKAARQALERAGVWEKVQARIVYGENVRQTLVYAESGNAEVAIVALSLVVGSSRARPVEPSLYDPLEQSIVVCKGGASGSALEGARAFAAFVNSDEGNRALLAHGLALPTPHAQDH